MADDLDDLIRRAMKTLDSQAPSGYFDALPTQTLARLEGSMQPNPGSTDRERSSGVPPVNEDSGLHDIRNLAQSTKQRLSSKRISTSPIQTDEDIVAASSAGWKAAVALPEPAKMISLPSIEELPSKKEVRAIEKAAAKSVAAEAPAHAHAHAIEARPAFSQYARPTSPKKSKAPLAIAGVLVAAAAGTGIYFVMQNQGAKSSADTKNADTVAIAQTPPPAPTPAAAPTGGAGQGVQVQPIDEPPPPAQAAAEPAKDEAPALTPPPTTTEADKVEKVAPVGKAVMTKKPVKSVKTKGGDTKAVGTTTTKTEETKPLPPPPKDTGKADKKAGKGNGDETEPNFDDLLKEAGVDQKQKVAKPKLDKKELSGDDFKKGMSAVTAAAQKCYQGTQGTASFKLTVAPSGKVSKVTVTGMFAGKPEGACVTRAVQSATFPPWDGGPQSFTYSYLLAE